MHDRTWVAYGSGRNPSHRARCRREPRRALLESVRDDARRHRPTRPSEIRASPPRASAAVQGSHGTASGLCLPALPTYPPGRCAGSARMKSSLVRMPPLPRKTKSLCGPVRRFGELRHSAHQRIRHSTGHGSHHPEKEQKATTEASRHENHSRFPSGVQE